MTIDEVEAMVSALSLEEKIGQLFLLAFEGTDLAAARVLLEDYYVGGVYLSQDNLPDLATGVELVRALHGFAAATPHKLPIIAACDQEGAWAVMTADTVAGPGNMALGAASAEHTRAVYRALGRQLHALGIDADLAPASDVNSNPRNPIIGTRSFGEDPERVARAVGAAIDGLHASGTIACAKHFPGHGDTHDDSHRGIPTVTREWAAILRTDLAPFQAAIAAGVDMVMTAHIIYAARDAAHPATLSATLLQGVLRGELGFEGVILTDSFNMGGMKARYDPGTAVIDAVLAGADVIMLAEERYTERYGAESGDYLQNQIALLDALTAAVRAGRVPEARIDASVRRILSLKARYGLFERRPLTLDEARETIEQPEQAATALAAARAAVVVVRNQNGVLPLTPSARDEVVVVSAVPAEERAHLLRTRGIGPNILPDHGPLDVAWPEIAQRVPRARLVTLQDERDVAPCVADVAQGDARAVVVITENYPLPGTDFPTALQEHIVRALCQTGKPIIVLGMRDPYELASFPDVDGYIAALGYDVSCAQAAVEALFGEAQARGVLPVTIAGVAKEGLHSL